ncbi:MAG: hypothetical protein Q4G23_06120 [Clostridia bacterium]|nr:hypothetical protein [Clostridia bacterium]
MNKGKHDYDFRNRSYINSGSLTPTSNAEEIAPCLIDESWEIVAPISDSRLVRYFLGDLCNFLCDAFGICIRVRKVKDISEYIASPKKRIILCDESHTGLLAIKSDMASAFKIDITEDSVIIVGKTDRGTAQGVYYIEDKMKLRGEARLVLESSEHAPKFSPRMTHSGTELDTFPDNFLEAAAHAGMDAIIVYAGHPDTNLHGFPDPSPMWSDSNYGYCDFNNLVWRAEGYGLDVYIYSHILCDVYPDDAGSDEYYEASFGTLFKNCPGIKGIIFVGETFEFPSKDERTTGIRCQKRPAGDNRPSPGWFPCRDYPKLLSFVKKTINKYNPDADIVFWTYNWGWAPKEDRLKLINDLPKDISLLVTFDMWQYFEDENKNRYKIDDYSISFEGPSDVFISEAEEAKERGVRLYAMANTGGRTWDNGVVPYLPVPNQWQKRYEALCRACDNYALSGLMENHHYGWMPSFLTLFSKNAFDIGGIPNDEMLKQIARRDFGIEADKALKAWQLFSEGISKVLAVSVDQYGPYRCGPAYPLIFDRRKEDLDIPYVDWAWHKGGGIWNPIYPDKVLNNPRQTLFRYERVRTVADYFKRGLELLEDAVREAGGEYGSEISRQAAVARFIYCTYVTTANVIAWAIAKNMLVAKKAGNKIDYMDELYEAIGVSDRSIKGLADCMRKIASRETENVELALTCWAEDSLIGFEASMEYAFNDVVAKWKNSETQLSLKMLDEYIND